MSLEQIVAPAAIVVALPLARFCWQHAAGPWWRRHVRLHGEIGVTIKLGEPDKYE